MRYFPKSRLTNLGFFFLSTFSFGFITELRLYNESNWQSWSNILLPDEDKTAGKEQYGRSRSKKNKEIGYFFEIQVLIYEILLDKVVGVKNSRFLALKVASSAL